MAACADCYAEAVEQQSTCGGLVSVHYAAVFFMNNHKHDHPTTERNETHG